MQYNNFVCPICKSNLIEQQDILKCSGCEGQWRSFDGIADFSQTDFYWNQIPQEKMKRLLDISRNHDYRKGLEDILFPETDAYTLNYALNESRGDFRFFIPVNRESCVLDLGCGWGAVTIALARNCKKVIALDTTKETLGFLKIRAEQEGVSNLNFARIDPLDYIRLPLRSESFDAVIMNGVLEWVGTERRQKSPECIQQELLQEIKKILKPNGYLYIGIENRYGFHYFLGSKDNHSGLRFTSVLPRGLANLWSKVLTGKDYRTYTHSYHGLQRMLTGAGFSQVDFYLPLKSYRDPYYIIPLEGRECLQYYLRNLMSGREIKYYLYRYGLQLFSFFHIEKHFVPDFCVICKAQL